MAYCCPIWIDNYKNYIYTEREREICFNCGLVAGLISPIPPSYIPVKGLLRRVMGTRGFIGPYSPAAGLVTVVLSVCLAS